VSFSVGVIRRYLSTIAATCVVSLAIAGCSKEPLVAVAPGAQAAASTQPVAFPHAPICDMDCMRQRQMAQQQKSVDDIVSKRLAAANSALAPGAARPTSRTSSPGRISTSESFTRPSASRCLKKR
jgi:hypothetical protein